GQRVLLEPGASSFSKINLSPSKPVTTLMLSLSRSNRRSCHFSISARSDSYSPLTATPAIMTLLQYQLIVRLPFARSRNSSLVGLAAENARFRPVLHCVIQRIWSACSGPGVERTTRRVRAFRATTSASLNGTPGAHDARKVYLQQWVIPYRRYPHNL